MQAACPGCVPAMNAFKPSEERSAPSVVVYAPPFATFLSHLSSACRDNLSKPTIASQDMRDRIAESRTCRRENVDDGTPVKAVYYAHCSGSADPESDAPIVIFEDSFDHRFSDENYMANIWEAHVCYISTYIEENDRTPPFAVLLSALWQLSSIYSAAYRRAS